MIWYTFFDLRVCGAVSLCLFVSDCRFCVVGALSRGATSKPTYCVACLGYFVRNMVHYSGNTHPRVGSRKRHNGGAISRYQVADIWTPPWHVYGYRGSARKLKFLENVHPPQHVTCNVSRVTCQVSCVTCHVSHVMCHMSCVTCNIFCCYNFFFSSDKVVKLVGGGSVINGAYPV